MHTAIAISDLRKNYGTVEAVCGLSLEVPVGSIFGFLGRNGAGKTTTIKTMLGIVRPAAGSVTVLGMRAASEPESIEIRRRTGFVSEDKGLYDYMTVEQMIRFTRPFYPRWRRDLEQQYLRSFELPPERKVKALSRGMRTKLALLLALCRGAELLILDEPTSGLDPAITDEVLQALVRHAAAQEATVFFSSHQIPEVEQIADHVSIVEGGRVVVSVGLEELRANYRRLNVVFVSDASAQAFRPNSIGPARQEGRTVSLVAGRNADTIAAEARRMSATSVDVMPVTLKELFLETVRNGKEA